MQHDGDGWDQKACPTRGPLVISNGDYYGIVARKLISMEMGT